MSATITAEERKAQRSLRWEMFTDLELRAVEDAFSWVEYPEKQLSGVQAKLSQEVRAELAKRKT